MPATLIEWRWLDKPPGKLLINLTRQARGLTIAPSLLFQADVVLR